MIKVLEQAIEKARTLPNERQEYIAELIEEIASEGDIYELSDDERRLVRAGTDQLDRREFASEAEVDAVLRRPWA